MKNKMIIFPIIAIIIVIALATKVINKKIKDNNEVIINNNNNFNLKLIKEVNKDQKENYLISPYSIEIALNLLKEGANNNTLKEIEDLIGTRNINDIKVKDRISIANAAFIKNEYKKYIIDTYINNLKNNYNSEVLYDDFKSPKLINDWVNTKTNGMIDKILDEIDDDFVLGLANALAIDVEWYNQFECTNTTSEDFTKDDGNKLKVEMMHDQITDSNYKYIENDNAKGIIIPYKSYDSKTGEEDSNDNNLEFVGILPKSKVFEYIDNITEEEINNLLSSAKSPSDNLQLNISLPRFKYDYELKDFIDVLKNLGIKDAFDQNNADFTKMFKRSNVIENLYIGEAIHKTHIDLNEKGTKAAAVTYFGMFKNTAIMPEEKEIINIEFNKPFIYIIRDKLTNEMLFFGIVYEPNKWNGQTCSE